jgi:conjugal transfer mating pair stabilization protein TraN
MTGKALIRLGALFLIAGSLHMTSASAQTSTAAAKADGKAFGREKAATAQTAASTDPDAERIPNFNDSPSQSAYFDNPDAMAGAAASQTSAHEGYRAIRSSIDQRVRFAPVDLDATIARSKAISEDPLSYTSGMSVSGTQGRCVPLPSATASSTRYFATCNSGFSASEERKSCTIPLIVTAAPITRYTYWCSAFGTNRFNRVDDCALFNNAQCTYAGEMPGICLEWETRPNNQRYCIEPGEPITILSCPSQVAGGTVRGTTNENSIVATRDESACAPYASDSDCTEDTEICTDSDPVTRIVNGIAVTQPCWAWTKSYSCRTFTAAEDCQTLTQTPGCNLVREDCLTDEPCRTWERVYDCPVPDQPASANQFICDGDVYCIDGACETIEREANDEFKDAVVALNALDQARREFDPNSLTLFRGTRNTCSSKVFGVLNCCKGKGFPLIPGISLLVALGCNAQELLLHERDAQGLCAYVGTYCSDSFLSVCLTKKKVYCCFESKLSRILQEQGRQQLFKPWGKPKTEACAGFTIDEFARLDLSRMDFSEVYAEFTAAARLPDELEAATQIQQKIEDYYANAQI